MTFRERIEGYRANQIKAWHDAPLTTGMAQPPMPDLWIRIATSEGAWTVLVTEIGGDYLEISRGGHIRLIPLAAILSIEFDDGNKNLVREKP
jgi:hypothetical protein